MKILVLGASGMLGHKITQYASEKFETYGTFRTKPRDDIKQNVYKNAELLFGINANNIKDIEFAILSIEPDVVINCIGIVKQLPEANNYIKSISINSLFPHQVAEICRSYNIRFIHFSTDCVFSGGRGNYTESDFADADDLYGRTKYLGEVNESGCLTLRTSIVGRELSDSHSLFEWFFSMKGKEVSGYRNAIFSGLTTNAVSDIVCDIITDHQDLSGLYNLSSDPIDKYSLLMLVKDIFNVDTIIRPDDSFVTDKSLNSDMFKKETGIKIPGWVEMINDMFHDSTPYEKIRR